MVEMVDWPCLVVFGLGLLRNVALEGFEPVFLDSLMPSLLNGQLGHVVREIAVTESSLDENFDALVTALMGFNFGENFAHNWYHLLLEQASLEVLWLCFQRSYCLYSLAAKAFHCSQ